MSRMTLVQAIQSGLRNALRGDENVLLLGEDIGRLGGVLQLRGDLLWRGGRSDTLCPGEEGVFLGFAQINTFFLQAPCGFGSFLGQISRFGSGLSFNRFHFFQQQCSKSFKLFFFFYYQRMKFTCNLIIQRA